MTLATEFPTYAELEDDIEDETGITVSNDGLVSQTELIHYCNRGIDRVEKMVMNVYKDYFLARDTLSLVSGTEEYAPPSDIYGMKIRNILFYDTNRIYEVTRARHWRKFMSYRLEKQFGSGNSYEGFEYFIINETAGAWKLLVFPTPAASYTCEVWYWRQANRIVSTTDVLDIPEGQDAVLSYMKYRCLKKQFRGNLEAQDVVDARSEFKEELAALRETLAEMVVDGATEIEQDHSIYEEHV